VLRTADADGFELMRLMEEQGIYPELAENGLVLLAASAGTSADDLDALARLLESVSPERRSGKVRMVEPGVVASSFLREQAMPMHAAIDAPRETVALEQALGRIAAEMVIPYPPGIPLLVPGERIDADLLELLLELRKGQTRFHGVQDARLQTIRVIDERQQE